MFERGHCPPSLDTPSQALWELLHAVKKGIDGSPGCTLIFMSQDRDANVKIKRLICLIYAPGSSNSRHARLFVKSLSLWKFRKERAGKPMSDIFVCSLRTWKPPFESHIQTEERRSTGLKSRHKGKKSYLIKWFLSDCKWGSRGSV